MNDGSIWDSVMALTAGGAAWFAGESGRILVASGLGGFVRWIGEERRTIRNGIVSWVAGGVTGFYTWPILLKLPMLFGHAEVDRLPENIAMAGFLMGAMGVSTVKIFVAFMEKRAESVHGQN